MPIHAHIKELKSNLFQPLNPEATSACVTDTCIHLFPPSRIYLLQWAHARPASFDNRSGRHPPEKANWSWGGGSILGQFMKKGATMEVSQEEGSIMHG